MTRKPAGPVTQYIGIRMRLRRKQLCLTQAQLGARIGVNARQVRRYEFGQSHISASRLIMICFALGVTTDYFLDMFPAYRAVASDDDIVDALRTAAAYGLLKNFAALSDAARCAIVKMAALLNHHND